MAQLRLRWSTQARERLISIGRYIYQTSPQNARQVVQDIREAAQKIPANPEAFSIVRQLPDPQNRYRFVLIHRYKIIYKIKEKHILILDIYHSSRDPDGIAKLKEEE